MKLGIFGGTFNPIHYGHLRTAEEIRELHGFDKIIFIPSGNPPLKSIDLADAKQRLTMVMMATSSNPFFEVSDIECSRPGRSYTVDTIEILTDKYTGANLFFMLGVDAFLDLPKWYRPDKLLSIANFILFSRPDSRFVDLVNSPYLNFKKTVLRRLDKKEVNRLSAIMPSNKEIVLSPVTPLKISATDIRHRIRTGMSIKYLLPAEVESFIISNKLYKNRK